MGFVRDIRPYYQRSSAVVVPIRAGGGTRIKILEAWSYRRPVVTSPVGIEGLAARNGEDALIAHDLDSFADCCAQLIEHPSLSQSLTENAREVVARLYSPEALKRTIAALDD